VPFATPTGDLGVEDLKLRYDCSKQTLYNRINAAALVGKRVKGKTFFTPEEVWCLDQVATFVERGVSLNEVSRLVEEWKQKQAPEPDLQPGYPEPDLRPSQEPDLRVVNATGHGVPPGPDNSEEVAASATALAVFAEREEQAKQLARAFTTAVGQALQDTKEVVSDPLRTHRLLAEAAKEEYWLSGSQLAEVCGVSSATVTNWRPHTVRCGFWLEANGTGLWEVRRATREEVLAHNAEHARPVPPKPKKKGRTE
jgi:DNA-binding transcriptional regulator YiaG